MNSSLVSGKTLAENAKAAPSLAEGQVQSLFTFRYVSMNVRPNNYLVAHISFIVSGYNKAPPQADKENWTYSNIIRKSCSWWFCG